MTITLTCIHEHKGGRCSRELEVHDWPFGPWIKEAMEAGWLPIFRTEALCPEHYRKEILGEK